MIRKTDIEAFIFTGGKSKRMGSDKALMVINGKEMYRYTYDEIIDWVSPITLVSSNPLHYNDHVKTIADIIPEIGPAGAVYTAMMSCNKPYMLLASCDMPCMTRSILTELADSATKDFITIAKVNDRIFPFPGFYPLSISIQWKMYIDEGERSVLSIIRKFDHNIISFDNSADLFLNVNSKDDIITAQSIVSRR